MFDSISYAAHVLYGLLIIYEAGHSPPSLRQRAKVVNSKNRFFLLRDTFLIVSARGRVRHSQQRAVSRSNVVVHTLRSENDARYDQLATIGARLNMNVIKFCG